MLCLDRIVPQNHKSFYNHSSHYTRPRLLLPRLMLQLPLFSDTRYILDIAPKGKSEIGVLNQNIYFKPARSLYTRYFPIVGHPTCSIGAVSPCRCSKRQSPTSASSPAAGTARWCCGRATKRKLHRPASAVRSLAKTTCFVCKLPCIID